MSGYMAGAQKREAIIQAGLDLWRDDPASVSARRIGKVLGMSHAGCLYHFGSLDKMRAAIAERAVEMCDPVIIPKLIVAGHPAVADMPAAMRQVYLAGV